MLPQEGGEDPAARGAREKQERQRKEFAQTLRGDQFIPLHFSSFYQSIHVHCEIYVSVPCCIWLGKSNYMSAIYVHWCRNESDYGVLSIVSSIWHNRN